MKSFAFRDDPQLEDLTSAQLHDEYHWRSGAKRTFPNRSSAVVAIRKLDKKDKDSG